MRTRIGLIRHGSTLWNKEGRVQGHTDNPLDEEGLRQAAVLAERLSKETWDYIYSSDMLRARQTAEVIAARLGLTLAGLIPGIREMNGGLIEGTTEDERIARFGSGWKTMDMQLESRELAQERGVKAIEELAGRHPGSNVLVVSHGAILRSTLMGLIPALDVSIMLKNTSVTCILKEHGGWTCELYNAAEHLQE
ncbi:histidine phosphatase family protein [Paenibacillus sp. MMS20-IR301]|uniref:histidine phosphatase family protein n=1 Tax=Paenibacillus sp. MMS20-IR301 TaxID=2895946 RepID=UPI0028E79794|nr:histidine phosphatase family protein [Paenibacillus sp. MMS20-IR301]WNS41161.1 histidine phosphatase family protein [Paenibacillus sp. MMS20-IR301]